MEKIILASKSKVRNDILISNGVFCDVVPSNVDEDSVKISLAKEKASPEMISKNLAELKANKVSSKFNDKLVLGADSVIDLDGNVISKPSNKYFKIIKQQVSQFDKFCLHFKKWKYDLELYRQSQTYDEKSLIS